ncbi:MAG: response regulator [Candidatus Muirbacterium halophilum]|nr:response regulator [Candidatus Muirbacterium halophilum]MCK9474410.1 response regulator [Candidatus Muirbacterium halophilum]
MDIKVLVVDDEEAILNLLRKYLEKAGFTHVITMNDPEKALELMQKELYKIVLLDINMPKMDGIELLEKIKEINPLCNIIMVTAYSDMNNVVDCIARGAVDFIAKPFKMKELTDIVNDAAKRIERWKDVIINNG